MKQSSASKNNNNPPYMNFYQFNFIVIIKIIFILTNKN
ncbi:Uncharacterised protein [Serratia proteamaculans]|nr:Uncharacterised protein [Serratia proteamaculans]